MEFAKRGMKQCGLPVRLSYELAARATSPGSDQSADDLGARKFAHFHAMPPLFPHSAWE
jgi:hypothetical protein